MLPTLRSRMMPSLWNEFFNRDDYNTGLSEDQSSFSMPAVNVLEDNDGFQIEVAAPGLGKKDFKIDLENNLLTISSEKTFTDKEEKEGRFMRREFAFGKFKRSFSLPDSADGEKINASYREGVLHISIPKKEEAKPRPPRQITIV